MAGVKQKLSGRWDCPITKLFQSLFIPDIPVILYVITFFPLTNFILELLPVLYTVFGTMQLIMLHHNVHYAPQIINRRI